MTDGIENANEALKEIELQKMLLENFGITGSKQANKEDMDFMVERVINNHLIPYDSRTVYLFSYEGEHIGGSRIYVHDTGDCVIVVDLRQDKLPTEVVKQLLLLGYKSENINWLGYKRRIY